MKLCTAGQMEGLYYKPRIDREILAQHSKGLIALSGCLAGEVASKIMAGDLEEAKAVVAVGRMGLVGEAEAMQRLVEPVSAAVSGEHPAGAVPAMGGGRQPHHEETGIRIAEARNRTAPIGPVMELPSLGPGDRFSMGDQSGTPRAPRDPVVEQVEGSHRKSLA